MKHYSRWKALFTYNQRNYWITVDSATGDKWDAAIKAKETAPNFWRFVEVRPVYSSVVA